MTYPCPKCGLTTSSASSSRSAFAAALAGEHLQSYLDEYAFRYNNRDANGRGMFDAFLNRIEGA